MAVSNMSQWSISSAAHRSRSSVAGASLSRHCCRARLSASRAAVRGGRPAEPTAAWFWAANCRCVVCSSLRKQPTASGVPRKSETAASQETAVCWKNPSVSPSATATESSSRNRRHNLRHVWTSATTGCPSTCSFSRPREADCWKKPCSKAANESAAPTLSDSPALRNCRSCCCRLSNEQSGAAGARSEAGCWASGCCLVSAVAGRWWPNSSVKSSVSLGRTSPNTAASAL